MLDNGVLEMESTISVLCNYAVCSNRRVWVA